MIGGRVTLDRHGREHFREIGRKGFETFVSRYFNGDRKGATEWLRLKAHEKKINGFVDRELQRQLDGGREIASCEMPVICDPDCDLPF